MSTHSLPGEGIEQLLHTETELHAPASLVAQARLKDYAAEYRRSVEDAEGFWARVAQELEWFQPWTKVFDWQYPTFEWFQGAKCNIIYNCLDRHVRAGRKNKVAYIWTTEDGTEQQITYGQLLDFVSRTANGLRSLGVSKGDRVIIYMPLNLEGVVCMLASDQNRERSKSPMLHPDASVCSSVPLACKTAVVMAKIPRCGMRKSPRIACFRSGAGAPASTPRIVARLSAINQINRGVAVNT